MIYSTFPAMNGNSPARLHNVLQILQERDKWGVGFCEAAFRGLLQFGE